MFINAAICVLLTVVTLCCAEGQLKNWAVNFKSDKEVNAENFEAVEKWITEKNGKIVDKLNSDEYKVIIANMDDKIRMNYLFNNL